MTPPRPYCERLRQRFQDYRDSELSPFLGVVIYRHLKNCAPCRDDYQGLERAIEVFQRVPAPDVAHRLLRKIVRNLTEPRDGTPSPAPRFGPEPSPGLDAL